MTLDNDKLLDATGWQILRELEANARLSFAELGRRGGLSLPAGPARVRKMREAGLTPGRRAPRATPPLRPPCPRPRPGAWPAPAAWRPAKRPRPGPPSTRGRAARSPN